MVSRAFITRPAFQVFREELLLFFARDLLDRIKAEAHAGCQIKDGFTADPQVPLVRNNPQLE
jgi:hypothetical protein